MSEGPVLAASLVDLLLATCKRVWLVGIVLGIAGTFRPMACFAVLGFIVLSALRKRWRDAIIVVITSFLVVMGALLAMKLYFGDPFKGVRTYANDPRAYDGKLFLLPFQSIIMTPYWYPPVPKGKIAYVWAHVALVFVGCALSARRFFARDRNGRDVLSFPWLIANSLFALTVGGRWGFQIYPRLQAPSEPALFWAYRKWLPRGLGWWVLIGIAAFAQSVINMSRNN